MSRGTRTGQGPTTQLRPDPSRLPWGVVGKATSTSTQAIAAAADITSLTTTFVASSNRVYKIEWTCIENTFTTSSTITHSLLIDGVQVAATAQQCGTSASQIGNSTGVYYTTSLTSASHTVKMQIAGTGTPGSMAGSATTPHILIVTDVGPA